MQFKTGFVLILYATRHTYLSHSFYIGWRNMFKWLLIKKKYLKYIKSINVK